MPVQDEGHVPFDKMPLRELRDWIEDWIDLPGVNVLAPLPAGGGDTTIINQSLDEIGYMRDRTLWLPKVGVNFTVAAQNAANVGSQAWCQRIVPDDDQTVTAAKVAVKFAVGHACSYQVGIYNADGTILADRTDWKSIVHNLSSSEGHLAAGTEAFLNNVDLSEDTEYLLVTIFRQDAGATVPQMLVRSHVGVEAAAYHASAGTTVASIFDDYWFFRANKSAGTWTDLPSDLQSDCNVAASENTPLVLLAV